MKHLTNYKQYVKNESVRDLAVGGLMALSTLGSGPDATKEKDNISQNQITQSDSIIKDLKVYPIPYHKEDTTKITIIFNITQDSDIEINFYDVIGQKINNVILENCKKGEHKYKWDGKDKWGNISEGIYFIMVSSKNNSITKRIVIN